jgi:tyrosine-protein phosphatase SIW14
MRRFFIFALIAATLPAVAQTPAGVARFLPVNDHLYRGAQPSELGIDSLAKIGIRSIIDLRGTGERSLVEKKQVEAAGMRYFSVPMPAFGAPADSAIANVLGLLDDSKNWPVFIHCQRGKDRTGTVVACYRVTHDGWENERALKEARAHGLSMAERGMRDFILKYKRVPHEPIVATRAAAR